MLHGVLPRCGAGHAAQARARGASGPPARHPRPDRHRLTRGTRLGTSYEEAGVSIAAGEQAVERIKSKVRSTFRPEVIGDIGGFGGLFAFASHRYTHPRSAEHTSELQSLMRNSYAVFCLKKKKKKPQ